MQALLPVTKNALGTTSMPRLALANIILVSYRYRRAVLNVGYAYPIGVHEKDTGGTRN
jgi:hypothetical protein